MSTVVLALFKYLTWCAVLLTTMGCLQSMIGTLLLRRFRSDERDHSGEAPRTFPAISVLKPLHGDEPLLFDALESFCRQDYPTYQLVFGVQRHDDPAIAHVQELKRRYPDLDLKLVIDTQAHGLNRKVGNLINMLPHCRYDILVISDSDIHVQSPYLKDVVRRLLEPNVGLVTTLYSGLPASKSIVQKLAASHINQNFLPGVLLSRLLGRQDCLGATMALRHSTLTDVGGLTALVEHVADDAILGNRVRTRGLSVGLARCMTQTTVAETSLRSMLAHELRWGRTVKNLEPVGYGFSSIQLPLFWASLPILFCAGAWPSIAFFFVIWLIRAVNTHINDHALGVPSWVILALLPVRDWLSAAIMIASALGQRVEWRGETLHIDRSVHTETKN